MKAVVLVCLVLVVTFSRDTWAVEDFADSVEGYEFVYHGNHDLLLTIQGDNCYYIGFPDSDFGDLSLSDNLNHVEHVAIHVIESNHTRTVQASNLDYVREVFGDVLANFRCVDKHIFLVWLRDFDEDGEYALTKPPHHGHHHSQHKRATASGKASEGLETTNNTAEAQ